MPDRFWQDSVAGDRILPKARVVCAQLAPIAGDLAGNVELGTAAIVAARERGADVIVLPEVVTTGYPYVSMDEARSLAIPCDHPIFSMWSALLDDAVLVFGFAETGPDGAVHNTAALLQYGAEPVFYRKTHLWDTEKLFFTPGSEPPPVVATRVGNIAMMVCYDMEFPEMTRSVALRGADLLAVPTNWPWVDRPDGLPAPEVVIAMAAARVNRLPIACCDRSGHDRHTRWNEGSTVIGADGWPVAVAVDGYVVADLDLAESRMKRISERNDVHADRRPELYP